MSDDEDWHDWERSRLQSWTWTAWTRIPYTNPVKRTGRPLRHIDENQPCVHCQKLNFKDLLSQEGYYHAPTFSILSENAKFCRLCDLIQASVELYNSSTTSTTWDAGLLQVVIFMEQDPLLQTDHSESSPPFSRLRIRFRKGCTCSENDGTSSCQGECQPSHTPFAWDDTEISICTLDSPDSRFPVLRGFMVDPDPLCPSSIDRARAWLAECSRCHQKCNVNPTRRFQGHKDDEVQSQSVINSTVPRGHQFSSRIRLLYIDDSKLSQPSGRLTSILDTSIDYVALSHRWNSGKLPDWVTTKANIDARMESFDLAGLPKTILDAIFVSKQLGFSYVWVDCFCIIQDDGEDWETQAAQMAGIYSHANLTISADVAADDDSGFSQLRKPMGEPYVQFQVWIDEEEQLNLHARYYNYNDGHNLLVEPQRGSSLLRNIIYPDLNRRGWTLQERVLSPRILHYGVDQMFWECRCLLESEDGLVFSGLQSSIQPWLPNIRETLLDKNLSNYQIFKYWTHIVTEYTKRSLTVSEDILPAISALASSISARTGGTYLAGLWRESLHFDLLWFVSDPDDCIHQHGEHPKSRRGPSWSWVNVEGVIRFEVLESTGLTSAAVHRERQESFTSAIELLDFKIDLTSKDKTLGRIERAILNLVGPIKSVAYPSPLERKGNEIQRSHAELERAEAEDRSEAERSEIFERYLTQLRMAMGNAGRRAAYHDDKVREGSAPLYAVFGSGVKDGRSFRNISIKPIGVMFYDHPDEVDWRADRDPEQEWVFATALKTVDTAGLKSRGIGVHANCLVLLEIPDSGGTYCRRGIAYIWGDRHTDWFENAERKTLRLC